MMTDQRMEQPLLAEIDELSQLGEVPPPMELTQEAEAVVEAVVDGVPQEAGIVAAPPVGDIEQAADGDLPFIEDVPQTVIEDAAAVLPEPRRIMAHTIPIHQLYTESIRKRAKKRRTSFFKFVLAGGAGAVLGGALVFFCGFFLWPGLAERVLGYSPYGAGPLREVVRQYEIEKVASPIEAIYEKVAPSIVGIRVTMTYSDFFFGAQETTGEGSGIVVRADGYILTNNHVVTGGASSYSTRAPSGSQEARNDPKIEVFLPYDLTRAYAATLVSRDVKTDIAVLKIDAKNLPVAEFGDSDQLRQGELVVAIGSMGGLDYMGSVTDGIISGLNRSVTTDAGLQSNLIQTNAAINHGNSGGALVNARGQVIGINVVKVETAGYEGLGFAIPINSVREVADSLIDSDFVRGRAKTGFLFAEEFNDNFEFFKSQRPELPKGVYVEAIEPLSGAFTAGLRVGDIVTKFNGAAVENYKDFTAILEGLAPGDIVPVEVFRNGVQITMELELSEDAAASAPVN
ncbi:MAG: trypsin-like peptidase domain-containing protein [Clostridiales bacterium]|jgi:serine protease Do|nr:trypsin-like peptidase domain-containing protein [Clostridiales bacterium]